MYDWLYAKLLHLYVGLFLFIFISSLSRNVEMVNIQVACFYAHSMCVLYNFINIVINAMKNMHSYYI